MPSDSLGASSALTAGELAEYNDLKATFDQGSLSTPELTKFVKYASRIEKA